MTQGFKWIRCRFCKGSAEKMQLDATDRLYKELNIVRRVRRLRSVGVLLKALAKSIDSDKIISRSKFYTMKERSDSSESDVSDESSSSGEDKIIYRR